MSHMNGAVPTTIIVAGLALAGYALVMTARNRRMDVPLLTAVGVVEILLLVEVGIVVPGWPAVNARPGWRPSSDTSSRCRSSRWPRRSGG